MDCAGGVDAWPINRPCLDVAALCPICMRLRMHRLAISGKTLNLTVLPLFAVCAALVVMYLPIARVVAFLSFVRTGGATPGVARSLMETAGARAGRDPRQAEQLRRAARAYLSVVR